MRIIDLEQKHENTYFHCLEEWSDEMKEAGDHKAKWYGKVKDKGLRVKLAENEEGLIVGMIQYIPAELSFVMNGEGYYMVKCIWVHGHKEGIGNHQKRGIGTMLLEAAEEDCRSMGVKGLLAWGISMPFWMRASWYKKHGYKKIDKDSPTVLMFKSLNGALKPREMPQLIRMIKKPPVGSDKVNVTVFMNGWCPASNIVAERTMRAVKDFQDHVELVIIDTTDRDLLMEWGIHDGAYIDGRVVQKGPPPSYDKIHRMLEKSVGKHGVQ